MWFKGIVDSIVKQFRSLTVEPTIFVAAVGLSIVSGSAVTTNLLIWKICNLELNYTEDVCANLSAEENQEFNENVLRDVNSFQMYSQYISSVPIILFSAIAGALSDVFGRKPLIFWSLFGYLLSALLNIVNTAFIETLPLEFFYFDNLSAFFGGYAVYYLGTYSFITDITTPKERAARLARTDGIEILGSLAGTFASPLVFVSLGYYGNYSISAGLILLGMIYLLFRVKEPVQRNIEAEHHDKSKSLIFKAVVTPLKDVKELFTKKRKPILKLLIILQFFCFWIYWMNIEMRSITYSYMLLVFPGFGPTEYSYYSLIQQGASVVFLIVVMPILSTKLKYHDSLIIVLALSFETAALAVSPYLTEYWQFFIAHAILCFGNCKYSLVRALMSRCILPSEVGKVFSVLAIFAALGPTAGNPLYRLVFDQTIGTYPGAIFLIAAALYFLTLAINGFIFAKRSEMVNGTEPSMQKVGIDNEALEEIETYRF